MITALTALSPSLPAVVNPNRPMLVASALTTALSAAASAMFNLWTAGEKTPSFFKLLQTGSLCFHQLPASFLQNRGVA